MVRQLLHWTGDPRTVNRIERRRSRGTLYEGMTQTQILYVDGDAVTLTLSRVRLRVATPEGSRDEVLTKHDVVVGSGDDCDVVLEDTAVSKKHCRLFREGENWVVADLGSTNGTFVNGAPIREAFVTGGAVVEVGRTQLQLFESEDSVQIKPSDQQRFGGIVGRDRRMRKLYSILERIAPTDSTVVIEGETGTGKEVIARTIHDRSLRREGPFLVFDCSAVPENLVESELFGHERGAFTGATRTRQGVFELADGGTVFLDELGELPLNLQSRLLRVLESREVRRVGGDAPIRVDVRVVAATNRDLESEVSAGRFREDLFYRLGVVRVMLPALRDRAGDIPLLVKHFLDHGRFNRAPDGTKKVEKVGREALDALSRYAWPGNIRELRNAVEYGVSFSDHGTLHRDALPAQVLGEAPTRAPRPAPNPIAAPAAPQPGDDTGHRIEVEVRGTYREAKERVLAVFEEAFVTRLLERHANNISAAARDADMDRKHLKRLMKRLEEETVVEHEDTSID